MKLQDDISRMGELLQKLEERADRITDVSQISSVETKLMALERVLENENIDCRTIKNPIKRIIIQKRLKRCDQELQALRRKYQNLIQMVENKAP